MNDSRLYVYAVVPAGTYQPRTTGIDGARLHIVGAEGGPRAVVHTHTEGPYDGPDEDVKRWILEHSDVVEDGWDAAGAVLPVSFNVIVRPDADSGSSAAEQLQSWLRGSGEQLNRRLGELAGKSELRVEISLDREQFMAQSPEAARLKEEMASRPAGVRRLLEKRLEKTEKEQTDKAADQLYPDYRARIATHCVEIQEYRRASREAGLVPVLTASCLVESSASVALGSELSAIRADQPAARIRFLGPWPPYSFADMSDNEDAMRSDQSG